jgi:hypothetical protein
MRAQIIPDTGNQAFSMRLGFLTMREFWRTTTGSQQLSKINESDSQDRKTRSVNLVILFLPSPSVSKSLKKQVASVIESANNARAYDAQRTLSWVHLASRYPVRVRVKGHDLFRVGESAVVIIRGR